MTKFGTLNQVDCGKNNFTEILFLISRWRMDVILKKHRFNANNSAADCLIFKKFCTKLQDTRAMTGECENLEI